MEINTHTQCALAHTHSLLGFELMYYEHSPMLFALFEIVKENKGVHYEKELKSK